MKKYRLYSKFIIGLCICLIIITVINFFTGIINPVLPGSSHVLCLTGVNIAIWGTVTIEKDRVKKKTNSNT